MSLTGKVYIVTGATGGLGPAVVAALVEAGAGVAIAARDAGSIAAFIAARQVDGRLDGRAVELTDEARVESFTAWAAERFGGLDGLVAVAGGFAGGPPVHETSLTAWQGQQETSLTTTFLSAKAIVPHLLHRGSGSIVTVSSRSGLRGTPYQAAYSIAKSGVPRLTEAMADELKEQQITVNAVVPSVIDTPANRAASPDADPSRWVKPAEIAAVIRWLLGPEARIVSGAAIPVHGRA